VIPGFPLMNLSTGMHACEIDRFRGMLLCVAYVLQHTDR